MKLSIIIPVFNAEKYLKKCLDSVINCKEKEIECILVNDGSKDSSEIICKEYCNKDNRFQLINKENKGVSSARNTGLDYAIGKYIMFLDADDYFDTSKWEIILNYIDNYENEFLAFSHYSLFDNNLIEEELYDIEGIECNDYEKIRELMFASSKLNSCWGKMFLRSIIQEHNILFRENLAVGEDFVFVAEYFSYCKKARIINNCILYYRQHGQSVMRKYSMWDRVEFTKILFSYNKEKVIEFNNKILMEKMYTYYFRVITNIFFEFINVVEKKELLNLYKKALNEEIFKEIINHASKQQLPVYKKIELYLFKVNAIKLLIFYYRIKSRV